MKLNAILNKVEEHKQLIESIATELYENAVVGKGLSPEDKAKFEKEFQNCIGVALSVDPKTGLFVRANKEQHFITYSSDDKAFDAMKCRMISPEDAKKPVKGWDKIELKHGASCKSDQSPILVRNYDACLEAMKRIREVLQAAGATNNTPISNSLGNKILMTIKQLAKDAGTGMTVEILTRAIGHHIHVDKASCLK